MVATMCGCFLILVGAMFPRTALVLLELFTDFNDQAFDSFWVGFIGFLFLPYTTLTFVLMDNFIDPINGFGWFVVALGFLADIASYGGVAQNRRSVAT
jgi:hypothetical protein